MPQENAVTPTITPAGRAYLQLHLTSDVGPIRLGRLVEHLGSAENVLAASQAELQQVEGVGRKVAESIFAGRDPAAAERQIAAAAEAGAIIRCLADADYPAQLKHIDDPPTCLFIKGKLAPTDAVSLAIVGTRRCSTYGREQAERLGGLLAGAGFTVVSGLARGVDGAAHRGALLAGGRTIGVLGCGLNHVYPSEHAELFMQIGDGERGALISELPLDVAPDAKNFPKRNRIIIGLALGVIVVEAGQRSGALITSGLAHDYNREVFALPGRIDQPQFCAGTNALIRDGKAKLVTNLEDVLAELDQVGAILRPGEARAQAELFDDDGTPLAVEPAPSAQDAAGFLPPGLTPDEQALLAALDGSEQSADEIHLASQLTMSRVNSVLTSLQLKGLVKQLPGHRFVRRGK